MSLICAPGMRIYLEPVVLTVILLAGPCPRKRNALRLRAVHRKHLDLLAAPIPPCSSQSPEALDVQSSCM